MILRRRVLGLRYEGHFFDEAAYEASDADIVALRGHGSAARWQCRIPEWTRVVSLAIEEDALLAGFEARARASIRNAERAVRMEWAAGPGERDAFYRAYGDFARRRGLLVPDPAEESDLDILLARDGSGELIQAAAFLPAPTAGVYRYRYGVSVRKTQANAGILFAAMRRAKALGYRSFDLGGIVPGAKRGSAEAGINWFKAQFGGEVMRTWLCLRGRTPALRALLRLLHAAAPLKPALEGLRALASRRAGPMHDAPEGGVGIPGGVGFPIGSPGNKVV